MSERLKPPKNIFQNFGLKSNFNESLPTVFIYQSSAVAFVDDELSIMASERVFVIKDPLKLPILRGDGTSLCDLGVR